VSQSRPTWLSPSSGESTQSLLSDLYAGPYRTYSPRDTEREVSSEGLHLDFLRGCRFDKRR
jgi:hypothetical protein